MANPRIIAGTARGIRLNDVPGDITRPITDRVKESLFNILGSDIVDSDFLDLFGGTGSVGIEALSRGAKFARFYDLNRPAISTIQKNLVTTHLLEKAEVIQRDAFSVLSASADRKFDYIYIAPPQYKDMWKKAMKLLDVNDSWFGIESWIIVQIDPVEYEQLSLDNIEEFEQRKYGNTVLVFFQKLLDQ